MEDKKNTDYFAMLQKHDVESDLKIGTIFRLVLMQSKLVIIFLILGVSIGISYLVLSEKNYRISSLMQVYSPQSSIGNTSLDFIFGNSSSVNIANLEFIYKSRSNMLNVIEKFQENISYDADQYPRNFNIEYFKLKNNPQQSVKFSIELKKNRYILSDEVGNKLLESSIGEMFENEEIIIKINSAENLEDEIVYFLYQNPEETYSSFVGKFEFNSREDRSGFYSNGGLLDISYRSSDVERGLEILNYTNNLFIENIIKSESQQANKALEFIDKRLIAVEEILSLNKNNLKEFQEQNKSINVDLEIKSIIESIAVVEEKINQIDIEISAAEINFTSSNPMLLDLRNQKSLLISQKNNIENKIQALPLAQQEYIDLFREVEISQQLYSELSNKKLEFSIVEASTLGNIRIIDSAFKKELISPLLSSAVMIILLTFILSLIIAIYRGLNLLPISNPAELSDNGIFHPIGGVVPMAEDVEDDRFTQSVESLIVSLNSIIDSKGLENKSNKTILLTSPTPSNGKSFISSNLAESLAKLGKKTLLIDNDLKRGAVREKYSLEKIYREDFYKLDSQSIENLKISDNFYVLPRISKLGDTFQFIYSTEYQSKLAELKKNFDFIIIDTPPILSVSDTSILMSYSDINVAIIRHGFSKINEVKQLLSINKQIGIEFDCIVYNAYEKPSSYYGYYGLYGNYSYQYYAKKYLDYSYDYKKDD